jgi:hypothetical protein
VWCGSFEVTWKPAVFCKKNAEVTEIEKKHIEGPVLKNVLLKVLFPDIIRANKLQPTACSANRTTLIPNKQNTPKGWRTTDPSKLIPFYANYIGISHTSTCETWLHIRLGGKTSYIKTGCFNVHILWGCAAASNLAIIQRYQAKILRQITDAPWYVTNHTLHKDLRIPQVWNCPSGTNRHSSHSTAISPKPTDGTNPRSAKQQAIAKNMDTWCDHLRQRRWTSPTLPPTRINALAHRDNNKSFSDC